MSFASTSAPLSKAEKAFIQSALAAEPALRADGRGPRDFRPVALQTGVAPLANGSARVRIGGGPGEAGGGTEVLAAVKLEIEAVDAPGAAHTNTPGRMVCAVTCSPAAYPHLSMPALDDLAHDLSALLHGALAHPSLHPPALGVIAGRRAWLLHVDAAVLADAGNASDALFLAARAALWDTRVPRTRAVEFKAADAPGGADTEKGGRTGEGEMDVDRPARSAFDMRAAPAPTDFELEDYWDEGAVLGGRERWPVCVTLNLLPPLYYLDASSQEEAATPLRLLLLFSFPAPNAPATLQAMRLLGPGEVDAAQLKTLLAAGEGHARELHHALEAKLREEEARRGVKARAKFAGVR